MLALTVVIGAEQIKWYRVWCLEFKALRNLKLDFGFFAPCSCLRKIISDF